jgi:methyl-accepting chemotaxis protein
MGVLAAAISAAVAQQRSATNEIAANAQQTASTTQDVAARISYVSNAMTDTSMASERMLAGSEQMARSVEVLNAEVDAFLSKLAA